MTNEDNALVEELLQIAAQLERERTEPLASVEALDRVQQIADQSSGTRRALAEVAVGFLRVLTRGAGGPRAVALYRFLQADIDGNRRQLLRDACSTGAITAERESLAGLLETNVLFEAEGRYLVVRSMRSVVREAADPIAFRMASWVERSRLEATGHKDPAGYIAGQIGCTREEAADYLRRFPPKT